MNIQDKMQEIHHKYGVTEMANYKIQLFVDDLIRTEKEQLRLHIVSQQRELLIGLLTKLENGGGNAFIDKEQNLENSTKQALTIPVVIHWVACKDKMPDNTNRILTWDGQFVQEGHYTFIDRKIVVPGFKFHNEITHWAKLPEPPCV